jgi:putative dimethyl sulfoxide reductase chaperone
LAFRYPGKENRDRVQALLDQDLFSEVPFAEKQPEVRKGLEILSSWIEAKQQTSLDETILELQTDYSALFNCADDIPAPPWESVYKTKERLVLQENTLQVRRFYSRYGLTLNEKYKEPDDHIGLELLFISYLTQKSVLAFSEDNFDDYDAFSEAKKSFLTDHLLQWSLLFCSQVEKYCKTGFYRGMSLLLSGASHELAELNEITLRLDACQGSKWSNLSETIKNQCRITRELLLSWNIKPNIQYQTTEGVKSDRPYWQADSPPCSRREMFRRTGNQGCLALASFFNKSNDKKEHQTGRNNSRLSKIAEFLPEGVRVNRPLPESLEFAVVKISESCIACGACARICPTGALQTWENREKKTFDLLFSASSCVRCEACLHSCPVDAIEIDHHPNSIEIFTGKTPKLLISGVLQTCEKCHTHFAGKQMDSLCPICDWKMNHPFGGIPHKPGVELK